MHLKHQGNRATFRNMLFIFQKKHNIESVNGFPKLHNALADYARSKGVNYCFLTPFEFNGLVQEMFTQSVVIGCPSKLLDEWSSFFKSSFKLDKGGVKC